ncbi:hypothetical protein ABPG72_000914 [Tetrahymena utriculariae]
MEKNQTDQSCDLIQPILDTELICRLLKKSSHTRTEVDIEILSSQLKNIKFFDQYNNDHEYDIIKECCKNLQIETFEQNDKVFEIGSFGEKFYIIIQGKVGINIKLTKQDVDLKQVKELKVGESFGEIALIYKRPRLATIKCLENCIFGVLSQKSYQNTLQSKELNKMLKEMSILYKMALFSSWTQNKLRDLYLNSMWLNYKKGDIVYDLGDSADSMFVIQEGEFVVYTNSNFEKIVGEDEQQDELVQFKRKIKAKENNKIQQYLKVRILCQGEYFGEEEILNESRRSYKIICNSFEGKVLMIKKAHFLNHVFQDEVSKQYILNRLKEKNFQIEERIMGMKNSLKDYKQFLYQDVSLAQQQILQKSKIQLIKYDPLDSHQMLDKLIISKKNIKDEKNSVRGGSTSPLKAQRTLPAIQSISSFTQLDTFEPSSPLKSQTNIQRQSTILTGDQFSTCSPTHKQQRVKFQVSQQIGNISPPKLSEITQSTNKNYEMYLIESPIRIQLSPSKNSNKQMKQLNFNFNENFQTTAQIYKQAQSMVNIQDDTQTQNTWQRNILKPQSMVIQDKDLQEPPSHSKNLFIQNNFPTNQQNQNLQQITSRTNLSISQHYSQNNKQNLEMKNNQQNDFYEKKNTVKLNERDCFENKNENNTENINNQQITSKEVPLRSHPLQNSQFEDAKDYEGSPQKNRKIQSTSPIKNKIVLINSEESNQKEKAKLKIQLKPGFASVGSTQIESPFKLNFIRQQKIQSNLRVIIPQSTCLNFTQAAQDLNQNILQQKQKSLLSQKTVNSNFKTTPIQMDTGINLFSALDQDEQNHLNRQIIQKINHQQELINLKNHQKTYIRQWRQRSNISNTQNKLFNSFYQNSQNNQSNENSKLENQTLLLAQQNQNDIHAESKVDPSNKSTKSFIQILENLNHDLKNDGEFSPYLKKKIKSIVKNKNQADAAIIGLSSDILKNNVVFLQSADQKISNQAEQNMITQLPTRSQSMLSIQIENKSNILLNEVNSTKKAGFLALKRPLIQQSPSKQDSGQVKSLIDTFDQKSKTRTSFQKLNFQSVSNLKTIQQINLINESINESNSLKGIPQNKQKILKNLISKQQVQIYFQKQLEMFNKANLQSNNQAVNQSQNRFPEEIQQKQKISKEIFQQKLKAEDDRKRKTVCSYFDSKSKNKMNEFGTQTISNNQQQNIPEALKIESLSPKKMSQTSEQLLNSGNHLQFPSFSTQFSINGNQSNQKLQDSQISIKISQASSPKRNKHQSQPSIMQNII